MSVQLSEGDLLDVFRVPERYNNPTGGVYQVVQTKKTETNAKKNLILINDGKYHVKALLRNNATEMAQKMELERGDVFRVLNAECAVIKEKKKFVLLIDEIEFVRRGLDLVNPATDFVDSYLADHMNELVILTDKGAIQSEAAAATATSSFSSKKSNTGSLNGAQSPAMPMKSGMGEGVGNLPKSNFLGTASQTSKPIFAIEQISPYQNNWTIKARISFKGELKKWQNNRGEGYILNVNLLDSSGEIRATAFNDNAVKFNEILQEGKAYFVSRARVQPAKPQFSNLSHPYELSLERDCIVEECMNEDANDVPEMHFSFVKLNNVSNVEKNTAIDVIGVLKSVGPHFELTAKSGKKFDRRDVEIVDDSGFSMSVGLWGEQAIKFNLAEGSVVALKGVRVTDFNGKSLSMGNSSSLFANPDIQEAYVVKGWYDTNASNTNFQTLKSEFSGGGDPTRFIAERTTIAKAVESNLGRSEKGDFFSVKAAVSFLRVDNFAYPACSSEGCQKKVIQQSDNTWRCEKCDINHPQANYRYMLTISIMDQTGQIWLTLFNDQAEQLLGVTANELTELKEVNNQAFVALTQKVQMNEYDFRIRAREDNYNNETRIRYTVSNLHELKWKAEADYLANELSKAFLN